MDDADRSALREVTRTCLERLVDRTSTATILDGVAQVRRDDWRAMAELGLQGAAIAEELGGAGLGEEAALLVHAEVGRALYGGPFLGTIGQVAPALTALGELEVARGLLTRIAAGELTAAALLPLGEPASARTAGPGPSDITVTRSGSQWLLDGGLDCVPDAELADGLLVAARQELDGVSLLWVDARAPGVLIEPLTTVDLTRRIARVSLSAAPAALLAGPAAGEQSAELARTALAAAHRGTMLALIAECVGLGERALEMTVGYVGTRHQFGRAIGSFQAVKHRCAEMLIRLEQSRSALQLATRQSGSEQEAGARLSAARICAGEAAFAIANEAIHLHGGIGFTWDYPVHLYYRRAKSNQQLLDIDGTQRARLGATVVALCAQEAQAAG